MGPDKLIFQQEDLYVPGHVLVPLLGEHPSRGQDLSHIQTFKTVSQYRRTYHVKFMSRIFRKLF